MVSKPIQDKELSTSQIDHPKIRFQNEAKSAVNPEECGQCFKVSTSVSIRTDSKVYLYLSCLTLEGIFVIFFKQT